MSIIQYDLVAGPWQPVKVPIEGSRPLPISSLSIPFERICMRGDGRTEQ
jgi:hypothetical protein